VLCDAPASHSLPAHDYKISMKPIRKAVVPVAGLETELLPATKAVPASKQAME
jgi:UTP--glucose-1-phosphate uridylyltransferase